MKTIMQVYDIIRYKKENLSNTEVAEKMGISRNTVIKYWDDYCKKMDELIKLDPDVDDKKIIESLIAGPKYDSSNRKPSKYTPDIDLLLRKILKDEEEKNRLLGSHHKQKLTFLQIHEMIVAQGYDIGETTIRNKIHEILDEPSETYIKQDYEYGQRFEYDFGEVKLIINGVQAKYYLAVAGLPASKFRWAYLYTNTKMGVFIDSHVRFFEMVGGACEEGVYDNCKCVVSKFIGKSEKELNEELIKLSLYYDYKINVTNCFSGNEKGFVESSVKWVRKEVFTKRIEFDSFEEASQYLQEKLEELNENSKVNEEMNFLRPYRPPFESADIRLNVYVNKYSFVQIDNNHYSVPEGLCEKRVTVKAYPNEIIIFYRNKEIARHARLAGTKKTSIEIRHYLKTFERKPGALRNSLALKSVEGLKNVFDQYYADRPKTFIQILRENSNLSNEELIEVLKPQNLASAAQKEVFDKTDEQIKQLMEMFIGGENVYH